MRLHIFKDRGPAWIIWNSSAQICLFSPVYLLNHVFTSVWTHRCLFHILGYNPVPLCCSNCPNVGHRDLFPPALMSLWAPLPPSMWVLRLYFFRKIPKWFRSRWSKCLTGRSVAQVCRELWLQNPTRSLIPPASRWGVTPCPSYPFSKDVECRHPASSCYPTRLVCPMHSKLKCRGAKAKWRSVRKAAQLGNKPQICLPKGKGPGVFMR